ncbi:hypothetical protein HY636_01185 [Candidatus Woesearchaeota archaeon]|nr:hypothetical protein [Candidatus Woesearchaeota archaeon]
MKEIQLTKPLQIAIYLTIVLILVSSVFLFSTLNQDFFGKAVGEVCQTDENCGENEHCENNVCAQNAPEEGTEGTGGTQGQALTGCNPECTEGQRCENGACVEEVVTQPIECTPACKETETCENNVCVSSIPPSSTECVPACKETETCENNICVFSIPPSSTECIPACAQGEICNEGICETPLGCTDDLNCAENEICNKATGECVSSTSTVPTPASTIPTSELITAEPIPTPAPIISTLQPKPNISELTKTPTPIIPTPECTTSTQSKDCTAGFACDNTGKCKTSCTEQTPEDCQQGFLCFEGICDLDVIDCMNNNGEPDNTKCAAGMFCSQDYLICIQCDEQHKCAKNFVCSSMGICQPAGYKEEDYEENYGENEQEETSSSQIGLQQQPISQQPPMPLTEQLSEQLSPEGIAPEGLTGGEEISDLSGEQTYDDSAPEPSEPSDELTLSQQQTSQLAAQQQQKLKQEFGAEKGVVGKAVTKQANIGILAKGKTYWWGIVIFVLIGSLIASLIFMHKKELALRTQSTKQDNQFQLTKQRTTSVMPPTILQQSNMNNITLQGNMQGTRPQTAYSTPSAQYPSQSSQLSPLQLAQQTSSIEQNFINYVESQLENGMTKDQIIVQLINLGWDKPTIQQLFTKYNAMFMDKNEREQILNYIRYYTAKGLPKESIKSALIKAGWNEDVIESLIKNY